MRDIPENVTYVRDLIILWAGSLRIIHPADSCCGRYGS